MNSTLGNYLSQLGGYGVTPPAPPTTPMKDWNMEDYAKFLSARPGTQSGQGSGGTGNLGKALMAGMGISGTGAAAGAAGAGGAGLLAAL